MNYQVEIEREEDGRWLGEITDLPGVMAYGDSRDEALALRVSADRLEHGEEVPAMTEVFAETA